MATMNSMCVRTARNLHSLTRSLIFRQSIPLHTNARQRFLTTVTETNSKENRNEASSKENPTVSKAEPDTQGPSDSVLKEQVTKLESELKEIKDKYIRSLAETENVRQRLRKQVEEAKVFGIQGFCKDLLEVADVLGRATESVPQEELNRNHPHLKSLFEGLKMTEAQLQQVFGRHGLVQIVPKEGDKFDPHFHEALFEVPTPDKETGTVANIQKIGYRLHQRTLRPALVGVYKCTS